MTAIRLKQLLRHAILARGALIAHLSATAFVLLIPGWAIPHAYAGDPRPECETDADCDDGDLCTDDFCQNEVCVYPPVDCDDSDDCTEDSCDPSTGKCDHEDLGQCCNTDTAACSETVEADCNGQDEEWFVNCDGCTPTGACCLEGGQCEIATEDCCNAAGGDYQGDDEACSPNPCCEDVLDLVIYKPPVIGEVAVSEEDEEGPGAQTFVNLDNDDQDATYDIDDNDITQGGNSAVEDELVKLELKVQPQRDDNDDPIGEIELEAVQGAASVRVWLFQNKDIEYTPGTPIPLNNNTDDFVFTQDGDFMVLELWVEGIAPHTVQQGTQLRLTYSEAADCEDTVALTIIGIEMIEWEGFFNSVNDDSVLDDDTINWPAGLDPGSVRVFPDARWDAFGGVPEPQPRDDVYVRVTLTVHPVEPVPINLISFDVDDPTDDALPVDDETNDEDNRGTSPGQAGQFQGEPDHTIEWTFHSILEWVGFQVTLQPGDNFRVVGNGDADFLDDLENIDSAFATNADRQRIVNEFVTGTPVQREIREPDHYASNRVLTVWRFLHVEVDSMGAPPGGVNAVINDFANITGTGTSATEINLTGVSLDDGSRDRDGPPFPVGDGRFQNGRLIIGDIAAGPVIDINPVTANGDNRVIFPATAIVPLPFNAFSSGGTGVSYIEGTVTEITTPGGSFVWTLNITSPNPPPLSTFVGGRMYVGGGGGAPITAANQAAGTLTTSLLDIPFILLDDDVMFANIPEPIVAGIADIYDNAYVVPLFDTGQNSPNAPFHLHTTFGGTLDDQINESKGVPLSIGRFWVVTVKNGYQTDTITPTLGGDNDPNNEGTWRAAAHSGVEGVMMCEESIRDWIAAPVADGGAGGVDPDTTCQPGRQPRREEIMNHEVGHLFGLLHGHGGVTTADPCGGVMAPSPSRQASTFTRASLDHIRDQTSP